jgi:hypothetical protein
MDRNLAVDFASLMCGLQKARNNVYGAKQKQRHIAAIAPAGGVPRDIAR